MGKNFCSRKDNGKRTKIKYMKEGVYSMNTTKIELKENWRFHLGECEEAWYKGYDDSSWRT